MEAHQHTCAEALGAGDIPAKVDEDVCLLAMIIKIRPLKCRTRACVDTFILTPVVVHQAAHQQHVNSGQ